MFFHYIMYLKKNKKIMPNKSKMKTKNWFEIFISLHLEKNNYLIV